MSGIKYVERTLLPLRKTAHAPVLPKLSEPFLPSAQDLVGVGLMPDIPDHLVPWKIEDAVQGDRQLHNTQIGCQMTSCLTDRADQKFADLSGKDLHFVICKVLYILRFVNAFKYHYTPPIISKIYPLSRNTRSFTHIRRWKSPVCYHTMISDACAIRNAPVSLLQGSPAQFSTPHKAVQKTRLHSQEKWTEGSAHPFQAPFSGIYRTSSPMSGRS